MATTRTSSAGKVSFGSWESEEREHPQGCSLFARPQGAEILQPERAAVLFLPHCAGVRIKGDILFLEREYPPYTPKRKDEGPSPSTPHIGSFYLEELHALRIAQPLAALLPYGCGIPLAGNQVRCTWLRHESLRVGSFSNRALLS